MKITRSTSLRMLLLAAVPITTGAGCATVEPDVESLTLSGTITGASGASGALQVPHRSQLAVYFRVRGGYLEGNHYYKWGGGDVTGDTWSLQLDRPPTGALSMGGTLGVAFLALHPESYTLPQDGKLSLGLQVDAFSHVLGFSRTHGVVYIAPNREPNPYRTWPDGFTAGLSCAEAPDVKSPDSRLKVRQCSGLKIVLGSGEVPKWVELE